MALAAGLAPTLPLPVALTLSIALQGSAEDITLGFDLNAKDVQLICFNALAEHSSSETAQTNASNTNTNTTTITRTNANTDADTGADRDAHTNALTQVSIQLPILHQ